MNKHFDISGPEEEKTSRERKGLGHFLAYHNAVPILFGVLFLSTSITMAASPAARDAVYSSSQVLRSVDNSYLLAVNLDTYPFSIRIVNILEDAEFYYLDYEFTSVDVVDGVWQDVIKLGVLRVSKALLGEGSLEEYAENELAQVREHEFRRLTETQAYERALGVSEKQVATVYSGLIGTLIDPSVIAFPAYRPPASADPNDPLAAPNAEPLVTWDENAVVKEPKQKEPTAQDPEPTSASGGMGSEPLSDVCPDMDGIQINPTDCTEEPPPSDTPTTPPAEEPPAPAPAPEAPPAEEPAPEPEPEPTPEPEPEPTPPPEPPPA